MGFQMVVACEYVEQPDFSEIFSVGKPVEVDEIPAETLEEEEPPIFRKVEYKTTPEYAESMAFTAAKLYLYNKIIAAVLEQAESFSKVEFADDYVITNDDWSKVIVICSARERIQLSLPSDVPSDRVMSTLHIAMENKVIVFEQEEAGPLATFSWALPTDGRPLPENMMFHRELRLKLNLKAIGGFAYSRIVDEADPT